MPILYTKINKNMKTINDMTIEEANFFINNQSTYQWFRKDSDYLVDLVRNYIDPHQQVCSACGSTMRTSKVKFVKFYTDNKEAIHKIADGTYIKPCLICNNEVCTCNNIEVKITKPKNKKK